MIPTNVSGNIITNLETTEDANLTFKVKDEKRLVGMVDDIEAVKQAVAIILGVERYNYAIYSWNFGFESADLIGKEPAYACPEITRRIKEALTQDDRITDVDTFVFSRKGNGIHASFVVHTIYGDIKTEKEVEI